MVRLPLLKGPTWRQFTWCKPFTWIMALL